MTDTLAGLELDFSNYPANGSENTTRKDIVFGSPNEDFVLLVELNPESGPLRVTVGNGPPHEDAPAELAEVLRLLAGTIERLYDNEGYWEAIEKLRG